MAPWAQLWEREVVATFLRAYRAATEETRPRGPDPGVPIAPARWGGVVRATTALFPRDTDDFDTLLRAFVVEKGLYELAYELNNRPDWAHIPLIGLLGLRTLDHA